MTRNYVQDLVPSLSVDALVMKREAIVEQLQAAQRRLQNAVAIADHIWPGASETEGWQKGVWDPHVRVKGHRWERDFLDADGLEGSIKQLDACLWSLLIEKSGIRTFMDTEARQRWEKAIDEHDVPQLTRDNIEATFAALYQTRGQMFERGVVEIFRRLSWDYKTNSPRMFGKRIILRYILSPYNLGPDVSNTSKLDDLIRVMSVLDGKPEPDHRDSAYRKLCAAKWPEQSRDHNFGYFSVRGFKNRNAHLTFQRPDLVDQLNRILAKHYPGALPPATDE